MNEWQQKLFPQLFLSRLMGRLANAKLGAITHFFIKLFAKHYNVNLSEAVISDPTKFESFNDFFTRALKSDARKVINDPTCLISPVDGAVSELGDIKNDQLLQAKGAYYSVKDLCAGDQHLADTFQNGSFITAYLSPKDYHRFHMPLDGKLLEMVYVPGDLFSVDKSSVTQVSNLFARNERVISIFETAIGKVAVIAVGAMIVGSVDMRWHGVVAPQIKREIRRWSYETQNHQFNQGDELGCFRLGSTVIVLCEKDRVVWDKCLKTDSLLSMGQQLATKI